MGKQGGTERRVGLPKAHAIKREVAGGWRCGCGVTGAEGDGAEHRARIAGRALRRLSDVQLCAIASVSDGSVRPGGRDAVEGAAVDLVCRHRPTWGALREHLVAGWDHWGTLTIGVDWPGVAAALAAGRFDGTPVEQGLVRVAASLVGATAVNLGALARDLDHADRSAVLMALSLLLPDDE